MVTDATAVLNIKSTKLNNTDGMLPAATDVALISIKCMENKPDMPINNVS